MIVANFMFDHPSWQISADSGAYRAVRAGSGVWAVVCIPTPAGVRVEVTVVVGSGEQPRFTMVDPDILRGPRELVEPLRTAGPVARLGTLPLVRA